MKFIRFATTLSLIMLLSAIPARSETALDRILSPLVGRTTNDVFLRWENYPPMVSSNLGFLQGMKIQLGTFSNEAQNTKQWSYPAAEGRLWYGVTVRSIGNYFWFCFKKALNSAGVIVLEGNSPGDHPTLRLTITYMSDHKFVGIAELYGTRIIRKTITVSHVPPTTDDRYKLEESAYRMMDEIISAVFNNIDLKKGLLGGK